MSIPNLEILKCFMDNIKESFDSLLLQNGADLAKDLAVALIKGDLAADDDLIFKMLGVMSP